jgi:hypothetical protein
MLQEHWESYRPPLTSEHAFVIVERRAHPNFRFILQNMAWAAPHMAVYLFCSDENLDFIEAILGDKINSFHIIEAFQGDVSREEGKIGYNDVMTDYRFYESISSRYILTIQMDNIIRRKIPASMFTGDYWGNPWAWRTHAAGGGGATVRRVAAMIELCKTPSRPNHRCTTLGRCLDRRTHRLLSRFFVSSRTFDGKYPRQQSCDSSPILDIYGCLYHHASRQRGRILDSIIDTFFIITFSDVDTPKTPRALRIPPDWLAQLSIHDVILNDAFP